MDGEGASQVFQFSSILIGMLGIVVGSIFISLGCCGRCYNRQTQNNETNTRQDIERNDQQEEWPRDSSLMRVLMPMLRYSKDCSEEDTCAVCLGEFKEGEQVRALPECLHLFHVPCIDMWLSSQYSCPLCRANAAPPPPPHLVLTLPDSGDALPPEIHTEPDFVV